MMKKNIQTLVKEPKDAGLKKHSAGVQKFLDELVKIGRPSISFIWSAKKMIFKKLKLCLNMIKIVEVLLVKN